MFCPKTRLGFATHSMGAKRRSGFQILALCIMISNIIKSLSHHETKNKNKIKTAIDIELAASTMVEQPDEPTGELRKEHELVANGLGTDRWIYYVLKQEHWDFKKV